MESSEPREPSYYEVALTNRQVLVAFVVLLTCLLAAFLSGVWVGRGAAPPRAARVAAAPAPPAAAPIEQLTFFSDKAPGKGAPAKAAATAPAPAGKPAAAPAADSATETMAKTLEAEMAKSREGAAATATPPAEGDETAPAPAATVPLTAGARTTQKPAAAPPAPAAKPAATTATTSATASPAATAAPATGTVWIQVYSSTNGDRAKQIQASLRKAKYSVTVAQIAKNGQTTWRVRVGPYETRAKADAAAAKLRREQKLDTWVTDTP